MSFFAQEFSRVRRRPGSGNPRSAVSAAGSSITLCRLPAEEGLRFSLEAGLSAATRKMVAKLPAY